MAASVAGGFWPANGVSTLSTIHTINSAKRRVAQMLDQKGMLGLRETMFVLTGAVAGTVATKTLGRVQANVELGGARTIETETLVNTASTAADVTDIKADMLRMTTKTSFGSSPVANGDGNPLGTR